MKKTRLIALLLVLVFVFALAACGGNTTPTNAPATNAPADNSGDSDDTPDTPPADDGEVYTLTWSYFSSEAIGPGQFIQAAAKNLEEASNGRLKFDLYFNGTLLGTEDVVAGCINRTADIVTIDSTIIGEVFALNNVFSMPYTSTPPGKAALDTAYAQLIKDCPELEAELNAQGLTWLNIATCGGYHLHGTSEMFDSPAKLSGKTIEGLGEGGNIITGMGGNGVTLDPGDYYLSVSTGLLDGMLAHFAEMTGFGLSEVLTTHVIFTNSDDPTDYEALFGGGIYAPMMGTVMNLESLNTLPADLQELLKEECATFGEFVTALDLEAMVPPAVDMCVERGDEFIFVGDEERAEWTAGMQAVIDKWVARCETAGYDGQAVYDHLMELFETAE
jgi:TRAP-type C4-dicarboxylate transport system substrate-binding protein